MQKVLRDNRLTVALAGLASLVMAWLALYSMAWNNYEFEAEPAFRALVAGHWLGFLRMVPSYGGSLLERAPFALLPTLWGGGALAVYRAVAAPGLIAVAVFAVWLVAQLRHAAAGDEPAAAAAPGIRTPRRSGQLLGSRAARGLVLALCVANPLTLLALEHGHPEELIGAVLCLAAVLLAARGRPIWAGILLGLAIANKEWALVAVGPVLVALTGNSVSLADPRRVPSKIRFALEAGVRRVLLCLVSAATAAAIVMAPLVLVPGGHFATAARAVASTPSQIFLPWSVWWFLGYHGPPVHDPFGTIVPGYRTAPAWLGPISHPAIVLVSLALSAVFWWVRRRRSRPGQPRSVASSHLQRLPRPHAWPTDALLLLALVLLARCLLDTWDYVYYPLPFLLALISWESLRDPLHPPLVALVSTVLMWASFQWVPNELSPDGQSVFFMAWTLPLAVLLAARLYAPGPTTALAKALGRRLGGRGLWQDTEPLGLPARGA